MSRESQYGSSSFLANMLRQANRFDNKNGPLWDWLVFVGLVIATVAVYWPVANNGFVDYDDGDYVSDNVIVQQGLTLQGLRWAFQTSHASNWHPLTWLSHMLDCRLFGLSPSGHHLTSLAIHVANTLLLFALLRRWTAAIWPAAYVAALFALHPIHVESVAWVAERKDVLSTFFGLLALLSYAAYAQQSSERSTRGSVTYATALACFALSLLSKPMLVSLPFILLLLDYWPGQRFQSAEAEFSWRLVRPRLVEKLPFLGLSILSCVVTYGVQRGGTVMPLQSFGVAQRLANGCVSYVTYASNLVWPSDLAFFYPLTPVPAPQAICAGLLILATTVFLMVRRRVWPFALIGWLWYLGMLVPVIGFVQVGEQARADRYMYLPAVGLFILFAWGVNALVGRRRWFGGAVTGVAVLSVVGCGLMAWRQVQYWHDSRSLLVHALEVTKNNFLAHNNLGVIFAREGDVSEAERHFREALHIKPSYARAHRNLAGVLVQQGHLDEAAVHYRQALDLNGADVESLRSLGTTFARQSELDQAAAYCSRAVELAPNDALARYDYALVLSLQGNHEAAAQQLGESLRIHPDDPLTHLQLGLTMELMHDWKRALEHIRKAAVLRPDWPEALLAQAVILAASPSTELRDGNEAVRLAEKANRLTGGLRPDYLATLAEAYAEADRFNEAIAAAERAVEQADRCGLRDIAGHIRSRLVSYRSGRRPLEVLPQPGTPASSEPERGSTASPLSTPP